MKNFSKKVLTLLTLATLASPALADSFYVGASAGQTDYKDACTGWANCDDTDTGYKLFAGYDFTEYFALEAFYTDLGESNVSGVVSGNSVTAKAETDAFGLAAVGTIPVSDSFSLFAKAGFYRWDLEETGSLNNVGVAKLDFDGTDFMFGLGASYDVSDNIALRIEWERFNGVDDGSETDIDLLSAGVAYSF